jgi:hypothetical protein
MNFPNNHSLVATGVSGELQSVTTQVELAQSVHTRKVMKIRLWLGLWVMGFIGF